MGPGRFSFPPDIPCPPMLPPQSAAPPRATIAHDAPPIVGVGLFTARPSTLTFRPAPVGTGLCFRRTDLPGSPLIPALHTHVVPQDRRTVLVATPGDASSPGVQTVEHVLSALVALGITDAFIDIAGIEAPIADGSSQPFVDALLAVGLQEFDQPIAPLIITEPITLYFGPSRVQALPLDVAATEYTYHLEYPPGSPIAPQSASITIPLDRSGSAAYAADVAPARTFSTAQEAQAARQMGLFAHLTPRDMLVIGPDSPIENSYRFPNEPARHKLLDLIGDLALAGRPIQGRIIATRTGHAQNHALAAKIAALPG